MGLGGVTGWKRERDMTEVVVLVTLCRLFRWQIFSLMDHTEFVPRTNHSRDGKPSVATCRDSTNFSMLVSLDTSLMISVMCITQILDIHLYLDMKC